MRYEHLFSLCLAVRDYNQTFQRSGSLHPLPCALIYGLSGGFPSSFVSPLTSVWFHPVPPWRANVRSIHLGYHFRSQMPPSSWSSSLLSLFNLLCESQAKRFARLSLVGSHVGFVFHPPLDLFTATAAVSVLFCSLSQPAIFCFCKCTKTGLSEATVHSKLRTRS